jgi:polyhydroxybutyrate depolymerase
MRPVFAAVLAALILLSGPAVATEESMESGGRTRWWLVHEPSPRPAGPLPLVLALHGGGGSPSGAERMTGLNALSDREGFIVVYPAGTGFFSGRLLTWNSGNCCGYARRKDVDDVGFLAALIERFIKDGRVDPKRVYATGMSNGAMMAHRLACERADLLAAIAPVAGAVGVPRCEPSRPVSVLMIHGRADQHVPYEGGAGAKSLQPRTDRSVAENEAIWRKADGCAEAEKCRDGTQVRVLTHSGGHIWPGGKAGLSNGNADPVLPEPKASEEIWRFFRAHPRP